jgi:hypothetical protein
MEKHDEERTQGLWHTRHNVWQPKASDSTGEHGSAKKGIPAAKTNMTGPDKAFDGGRSSGVCYTHDRKCSQ